MTGDTGGGGGYCTQGEGDYTQIPMTGDTGGGVIYTDSNDRGYG